MTDNALGDAHQYKFEALATAMGEVRAVLRNVPIFLDLDGVFADFFGVAARLLGRPYKEMPAAEAWAVLEKAPGLYRDLPMLAEGRKLWDALQPYLPRLQVLSALPLPTGELETADVDKRFWVRHNMSATIPVHLVVGGVNKVKFVTPGAVLIDDLPRNIDLWRQAGGIGILHVDAVSTMAQLHALTADEMESPDV